MIVTLSKRRILVMDHADIIGHCKKEIENAENEIRELMEYKKQILKTDNNKELIAKLLTHAEGKKEIYETLLEDIKGESH
jgi:hypothetical protein